MKKQELDLFNQANEFENSGLFYEARNIYQQLENQTSDFDIAQKAKNKVKELSSLIDIDETISKALNIQEPTETKKDIDSKKENGNESAFPHKSKDKTILKEESSKKLQNNKNKKSQKPIYKRVWFWGIIAFFILMIVSVSSGSEQSPSNSQKKNTLKPRTVTVVLQSCDVDKNGTTFTLKSKRKNTKTVKITAKQDNTVISEQTGSFDNNKETIIIFDSDVDLSHCNKFELTGKNIKFSYSKGDALALYTAAKSAYDEQVRQELAQKEAQEQARIEAEEKARQEEQSVAAAQQQNDTVYITPTGTKYHSSPNCPAIRGSYSTMSLSAAQANGYTPCQRCH